MFSPDADVLMIGMASEDGNAPDARSIKPCFIVKGVSSTSVSLYMYNGSYGTFMEWKKSVEYSFGKTGYNKLLFDKNLCKEFDNTSYSMRHYTAVLLHTWLKLKRMRKHVSIFFDLLIHMYNEKFNHCIKEFQQWIKLFNNSLDKRGKCASFINDYELCVSAMFCSVPSIFTNV